MRLAAADTPVKVGSDEIVPVAATLSLGPLHLSVPMGAYVPAGATVRFRPTVEVVGLAAAVAGIYTGLRLGQLLLRSVEPWIVAARASR